MANTYTLISSNVLTSSAASVTFSSIPSTYTDLVLKCSVRSTRTGVSFAPFLLWTNNASSSDYSFTRLSGNGASATSARQSPASSYQQWEIASAATNTAVNAGSSTSNTFTSIEAYFPSYAGSTSKPGSLSIAAETNATTAYLHNIALLKTGTTAISSIGLETITDEWAVGSSFFLYGVKNS